MTHAATRRTRACGACPSDRNSRGDPRPAGRRRAAIRHYALPDRDQRNGHGRRSRPRAYYGYRASTWVTAIRTRRGRGATRMPPGPAPPYLRAGRTLHRAPPVRLTAKSAFRPCRITSAWAERRGLPAKGPSLFGPNPPPRRWATITAPPTGPRGLLLQVSLPLLLRSPHLLPRHGGRPAGADSDPRTLDCNGPDNAADALKVAP